LIRHLILAAPLTLGLASTHALAAGKAPPPAYAAYVAAARKADAIGDPLQRCLAYPDLPGNQWAPGVAKARCVMFNTPPMFTLDGLEKALAQPEGAKGVDAKFGALLDAHYAGADQREQIFIAFRIFEDKDRDKAERIARAWLAASPGSPFALTALGKALAARGWEARGTEFVRNTPADKLQRMEAYFVDAAKQYAAALEANPKLLPACVGLMSIGRQSSDEVETWATKSCVEADPASYFVVDEMMTAAEPRWGGSAERMRAVGAYAQARVKDNPVLAVFAFHHAFYEIDRADDGDAKALSVLEPAAALVPNAAYLRKVGGAYLRTRDYWKSFVYLSQALRFMPDYAQESRWRALVLYRLGESQWARTDAERAVALDPDDRSAHQMLAAILRDTAGPEAARPHYARAMNDANLREDSFVGYCWTWIDAKQQQDAAECVDSLLKEYPDNGEAWRLRLIVLGPDAPEASDAMKRFLATQDPKRWPSHKAVAEYVRTQLAEQERIAATSGDFKARYARASALERTQEGRDYLQHFMPKTNAAIENVFGACFARKGATSFTAVMDVLANGKIANVEVWPVNAQSSCYAKRVVEMVKAPRPPAEFADKGFPVAIYMSWK
jgi:tetratricopeptide (TPR) repeat protein